MAVAVTLFYYFTQVALNNFIHVTYGYHAFYIYLISSFRVKVGTKYSHHRYSTTPRCLTYYFTMEAVVMMNRLEHLN